MTRDAKTLRYCADRLDALAQLRSSQTRIDEAIVAAALVAVVFLDYCRKRDGRPLCYGAKFLTTPNVTHRYADGRVEVGRES